MLLLPFVTAKGGTESFGSCKSQTHTDLSTFSCGMFRYSPVEVWGTFLFDCLKFVL